MRFQLNSPDAPVLQRWLPQVNPFKFTVLYQVVRDPTSGRFDLTKASVRVQTSFITFASCVKHLEVTGKQKSGVRWEIRPSLFFPRATHAGLSGPRSSTSGIPGDWER